MNPITTHPLVVKTFHKKANPAHEGKLKGSFILPGQWNSLKKSCTAVHLVFVKIFQPGLNLSSDKPINKRATISFTLPRCKKLAHRTNQDKNPKIDTCESCLCTFCRVSAWKCSYFCPTFMLEPTSILLVNSVGKETSKL